MRDPNSMPPSKDTVEFVRNTVPELKSMIGDITKSIVAICNGEIRGQDLPKPDWYNAPVTVAEAKSILGYIQAMTEETSKKAKPDVTVDQGINLIDEFLAIANNVKTDLRNGRLDAERCKYFIRSGCTVLNYFDDLLAQSA